MRPSIEGNVEKQFFEGITNFSANDDMVALQAIWGCKLYIEHAASITPTGLEQCIDK